MGTRAVLEEELALEDKTSGIGSSTGKDLLNRLMMGVMMSTSGWVQYFYSYNCYYCYHYHYTAYRMLADW